MIQDNEKAFAVHVFSQTVQMLNPAAKEELLTVLTTRIPNLGANRGVSNIDWEDTIGPRVIDFYAKDYSPGKLRAAV